jgi:hypothetical protein
VMASFIRRWKYVARIFKDSLAVSPRPSRNVQNLGILPGAYRLEVQDELEA